MERKRNMEGPVLAFASYQPKEGQEAALIELVNRHLPTLRQLGLATDNHNYVARSADSRIIEVFEWTSGKAIGAAHEHPAIADIWEKMALVADFTPFNTIGELNAPFVNFELVQ